MAASVKTHSQAELDVSEILKINDADERGHMMDRDGHWDVLTSTLTHALLTSSSSSQPILASTSLAANGLKKNLQIGILPSAVESLFCEVRYLDIIVFVQQEEWELT